jgi:O-antigen ligase
VLQRVFSGIGDPNFTSLALVLGVGGALGLALTLRRRSLRILAFLAAVLLSVGVVRTVSLGGAIGLLALLALLVLGARGLARRVPKQLVPIVTGLCLVLAILGGGTYWVRLRSEIHRGLADPIALGDYRLALLIGGARMVAAHPLFGVGPGRVSSQMTRYEPARGSPTVPQGCHNLLFELGDESGLVPAVVVTVLLGVLITGLLRRWRARLRAGTPEPWGVVITATLLATLLQAMALPAQRSTILWLVVVLAAAHLVSDPKPEEAAALPAA